MLWDLLPIMKYLSLSFLFSIKLESFSLNTFEERQGMIFTLALLIPLYKYFFKKALLKSVF